MGFRGSVVILVALFAGCQTKERPDSCSAETGTLTQSGDQLIQLRAQDSKKRDDSKEMDLKEDCTAVAYEDTGRNVERKGNKMCGPYSSDSFVDTCLGIDTIQVPPGCSFQVSSEPGGKGSVSKFFTKSTSMGATSIGYDKVRSIRVFKSEAKRESCTKLCYIYGDPHFVSFDKDLEKGDSSMIQREGTFWVVKSDDVHIQILASRDGGRTRTLAISGPFIDNHKLALTRGSDVTWNGKWEGEWKGVTWDTESVLQKQGDRFVKEVAPGKTVEGEHLERVQPAPEDADELGWGSRPHGMFSVPGQFKFMLPLGITIYASRRDAMSIIIKMPRLPGGQDGLCGNFDKDEANDKFGEVEKRGAASVASAESLFPASLLSVSASQNTEPTNYCDENSPQFKEGFADEAQLACAPIFSETLRKDCVIDICTTGRLTMEADEEEVEVLASEATRGH